ncbi:unnamed protein product [Parascedosporium putredinis]|uniref:Carboxypeptidase Y n=1 Tax=Parascedosporium putredinis TaxID=1442378 RepID=A0A9P1HD66_9PEZI|nr:unnamed protein product [Parascedosporium putredinis]CAI8004004.1 unnamed protein product [Parascedosporium putredinis]
MMNDPDSEMGSRKGHPGFIILRNPATQTWGYRLAADPTLPQGLTLQDLAYHDDQSPQKLLAGHASRSRKVRQNGDRPWRLLHDSWTNFANMLFVEYHFLNFSASKSIGLSTTNDSSLWPDDLLEGGVDFLRFLEGFLKDLFPHLSRNPIHFVGESFGGKYVPVYAAMSRRRAASVILVDPLIDLAYSSLGLYEHFCPTDADEAFLVKRDAPGNFNKTVCEDIERQSPACEKDGQACRDTYDGSHCDRAVESCTALFEYFEREVVPGGRHPYDDRLRCTEPPLCGNMGMDEVETYLNLPRVQTALGFKEPVNNTEGLIRALNNLQWSHQAGFRAQSLREYRYEAKGGQKVRGGDFKTRGNLTLIDPSGIFDVSVWLGAFVRRVIERRPGVADLDCGDRRLLFLPVQTCSVRSAPKLDSVLDAALCLCLSKASFAILLRVFRTKIYIKPG